MTSFVETHRGQHGVEPICRVLDFNPSTYWSQRVRPLSDRALRDKWVNIEIKRVFDANVARPADLVDRNFTAMRPNQLWVADLTYIRTWAGRCFVALVIDVYSRFIVGWALATHLRAELPLEALEMAIWRRDATLDGLVHHSDRGSQYTSICYTERLDDAGIAPSVGSVGDAYDNALAETTIGLFETELINKRGPWRSPEQVELATLEWIDWWNHRRLHEAIGNIPPAEKEAMYYKENVLEKTLEIVG